MIKFGLCYAADIREDLEKLIEFKERWFELITGWRAINNDERDLERSTAILAAILVFENLLPELEKEEREEEAKKLLNLKN